MGSIKRKIVGNKVYTYNGNKLIHVTDRGTGTGTGTNYDITKTTKQQNNTVKNTNKSNKNADGTWKNQTMVTGSYFGAQSNQQQNKQQTQPKMTTPTVPGISTPQLRPISVSKDNDKSTSQKTGMRERVAEKNKGKVAVAGKGLVDRGASEKSYGGKKNSTPVLDVPTLGGVKVSVGGDSLKEAESYGALYGQMKGKNTGKKTDKSGNIGPYDTKGLQTKAQNIKSSKITDWAQLYASRAQVAKDVDAKYEVTQQIQNEMDSAGYTKAEQKQMWAQIEKESGFKPQTNKSTFSRIDNLTTDKKIVNDIQKAQIKNSEEIEKDSKELQNLSKAHSKSLNDAYAKRKTVRNSPNLEERSKGQTVKSGTIIGEAVKNDPGLLNYIKKLAYSKSYYTDKEKKDAVTAWRMLTNGDRRQNAEALGMSLNDYNSLAATLSMRAREIEQGVYEGMAAIIPGYDYMQGGLDTENFDLQKYLNGGFDPGTYYTKDEQKQIANNLHSMQTARQIGGAVGTVVSMLLMNYGTSAIANAASRGLKAGISAGKISQRTSNMILKAASKTGMPTALTLMSASRKGYDWNNFGTDWLKNMIMLNVMGATESKISGALKGLLSNSKYATSNLAMTGVKVASSAGGAGAGVLSTVPLNTKEENERLGEQWATLTLYSVFNNVIGGLKNSPKQVEAGMADILNSEAEYKAALKEYIQNENIEGAIEHARNARALHDQGREILTGKNSEMMYGFNKSQKQQLLDAYEQIGQGLANLEIDLMADYPGSGAFGSSESTYKGSYMALPAGAESEQAALDNIKTPVLDQYVGGKAVMDAIIGRQPTPADNLPMIAKYGGNDLAVGADAVIKGGNALALNTDSTSMITKYAGPEVSNEVKEDIYLAAATKNDTQKASQLVAEKANQKGYNIEAYHGTSRADRVGDVFLPERSTSGPMAFFTDSKEIADNYANDKRDTSLSYDDNYSDYYSQFRTTSNGENIAVSDVWNGLSSAQKAEITDRAKHITLDEEGENIVYDPNTNTGLGNFDQYLLREHKGNAIEALIESWLIDGNLYGEEGRFKDVLKLAGIDDVQYLDPDYKEPKTYHVFLRIQNPFDTANVSEDLLTGIKEYAENNTGIFNKEYSGADLWDKNRWTVDEWVEKATEDMKNGTTYAWTSIPDFVSGYLKELGYDGIKDLGGKYSGAEHTVYIPFASEQIKSAEPFEYDKNGDIIPLEKRFDDSELSIKYKLNNDNGGLSYNAYPEVFDADEKWVGIRETGGYERLCESSASYEERLAAAENIRRSKSYEETSVVADDGSETTINIVTDESLLPEDARVQREYISNKYGLITKYFLGGADADIAEGASLADAFVTSEGIVYLSLESKGMLSNGEHECFHWIYYANQEETDVFASNILALLNANNEYDAVMLDYSNEYWFYTIPNDVFQEVLSDLYAGKLTLSDQGKVDEYIKDLKASIEKSKTEQSSGLDVKYKMRKDSDVGQTPKEFQQTVNEAAEEPAPVIKPHLKSKLSKQYDRAVKEFTDNAFSLMNISGNKSVQAELKTEIERIAANTFETGMVDNDAVTDLVARMWDAGQISENYIMDNFPELKEYFRKTAIKVSDAIQRDITDYNAWRKSQMGNLNITHNTGTPVDAVYQELSARYPALFPEDIINPTEQLMRMAAIRQQMRGTTRSNSDLYSDDQRAEIASMANRLVDTLEKKITGIAAESRGEAIPGYSPENLLSLDAQDPLNQDPDWTSLQQQEPVVETEGEKLKNWKETKRRVSLTSQVLDMTRRVQKAAKTAQPELRAKMIEEFGTIVPYFKGMSDGKRINLQKQIDDLDRFRRENPGALQYVWDPAAGVYKQDDPIIRIMTQLNGKLIAEMTNDELYQLFKNGQMLMHQYKTAKKEIREQGAREISDLGETAVKQMKTAGPKALKDNDLADFISVKMLSPDTFAKEVDGYAEDGVMQRMFEGIREGQTKAMDFRNRAYDKIEDFNEKHKKFIDKNWRGKKQTVYDTGVVPINGTETLKMTAGERIALYLNSLDYDAMRHMVGGQYRGDDGKMHTYEGKGITVPNQRLWEKGKLEEAYNAGKNYRVTEKMIQRIIDTMTSEEKEWADLVFKEIYNGICPTEANKVSLALDGWERFIKNNYYRIITDQNYVQTVFESLVNDITVEGQGFTKERQNGANSPILLVDAFNALDSHIDGVAKYIGYAAPMRNITKVLNYSDGTASVKAAINERMGSAGMRYIEKYIADMQGGGKKSKDGMLFSKARSGYAGATLTINPGVVFMQAASIPTAAAYLGWNNMKGIFRKVDGDTVKKYSVYYRYRSKGNYTADFDDLTKNKTMLDRLPMFNWIQQMDNAAVKRLWGACECYVEEHFPNLKKGSEEYLKKVGETLDKCVSLTQPNYTTAERPDVMRTDSDFLKIFTMFKTQPFQNLNLGWSAGRNVYYKSKAYKRAKEEGRDGKKEKEELKKAWKGLGRTASALTVAAVMIAAIRGVSEMLKGRWDKFTDENGEFSLDGLFNYIGKETGGSLAGSVIGGNELYSFISSLIDENSNYYDISAPQLSVINDFTSALKNMYDVFSAVTSGDRSPKALFRSSEKLAETIGTMFGVPIANVRKYVGGIIGNFSPEFKAEYEDLMYGVDPSDVKNASGQGWGSFLFGGMADTDAYFNKVFENRNGKGITTENRDEIKRLYLDFKDITGDVNGMFLSDPDQYTYNGIKYDLKEDDKKAIREMAQAEIATNINKLMESRAFAGFTDEQKIKAIKELTSYAADTARNEWLSNHNQSVDKGKDFDKVGYALFKASVNDDMTTAEKKQKLLDLNFNDYTTASVYAKAFETKSTKEENSIAYKMEHTSKSAAEIIRESLQEKAEKEKSAKESVVNESTTKIKEAEGYTLPNFRASTLQAIADIGISPEDYAYVSDRLDGHDDKVDYINSLPFDKKTKQGLVDDLVMGDKAHDKMKVAEEDYNIPNSTYIDTYMFGYESTGSKKERNQKIQDYVNDLPGLNDSQKDYLYWANQVYRKKEAVGGGESGSYSGSESGKSSSGGRRSGRRRSSGGGSSGGSGGSTSSAATIPEAQGYTVPKYRKDKLAKISDMGLTAADYAYVTDRVASTDNKVGYIKSLGLSSKATQGLISDLVMDATGRRKMTVGAQDYGIPTETYTQAYMYAYETTGSKAERNEKIKAYVNAISGLDSKQKTYLTWAVQANKSNGQTEGSGGSSGGTSSAKVSVKAAPSVSRKSVSNIAKSSISKYIASNLNSKAQAQKNADYAAQVKSIDNNVFMTAKQKAAAKKRLQNAFGK